MSSSVASDLRRRDRALIAVATLGAIVALIATAFEVLTRHHGDGQVFFRAGWAIWAGHSIYAVTDDHGWSYHYPPFFALLMGPFANPPLGVESPWWAMPYPVAVVVWCVVGLAALAAAAHALADAIDRFAPWADEAKARSRYWPLRLAPSFAMAPFLGVGLTRGQTTTIILFLMVAFLTRYAERRHDSGSLGLSAAIAIKMFPAALLVLPALRRDFRVIAYAAAFLFMLLFLVPGLCLGLQETIDLYRALWTERLQGMITGSLNPRIQAELSPWSINAVGVGSMLARLFSAPSLDTPYVLPFWAQAAQLAFDAAVVSAIFAAGHGRFWRLKGRQPSEAYPILLAGAALLAALPPMLWVARPHYWALQIPLITCLYAESTAHSGGMRPSNGQIVWAVAAAIAFVATGPDAPGVLARLGPTTIVMLAPILAGVAALRRLPAAAAEQDGSPSI
jgi:hypothetical protein